MQLCAGWLQGRATATTADYLVGVRGASSQAHTLWRHVLLLLQGLLQEVHPEQDGEHLRVQAEQGLPDQPEDKEELPVLQVSYGPLNLDHEENCTESYEYQTEESRMATRL